MTRGVATSAEALLAAALGSTVGNFALFATSSAPEPPAQACAATMATSETDPGQAMTGGVATSAEALLVAALATDIDDLAALPRNSPAEPRAEACATTSSTQADAGVVTSAEALLAAALCTGFDDKTVSTNPTPERPMRNSAAPAPASPEPGAPGRQLESVGPVATQRACVAPVATTEATVDGRLAQLLSTAEAVTQKELPSKSTPHYLQSTWHLWPELAFTEDGVVPKVTPPPALPTKRDASPNDVGAQASKVPRIMTQHLIATGIRDTRASANATAPPPGPTPEPPVGAPGPLRAPPQELPQATSQALVVGLPPSLASTLPPGLPAMPPPPALPSELQGQGLAAPSRSDSNLPLRAPANVGEPDLASGVLAAALGGVSGVGARPSVSAPEEAAAASVADDGAGSSERPMSLPPPPPPMPGSEMAGDDQNPVQALYSVARVAEEGAQYAASAAAYCGYPQDVLQVPAMVEAAEQAYQRAQWAAGVLASYDPDSDWMAELLGTLRQITEQAVIVAEQAVNNCKTGMDKVKDQLPVKEEDKKPKRSRVPCKYFEAGYCEKGEKCLMSHNPEDRKPCPMNQKRASECSFYLKGVCARGEACNFAHGAKELDLIQRYRMALRMEKSKIVTPLPK
mmetsp:Transcript_120908/g.341943  ORF Transcript_120908/g.341943 Transcript_120908/m.341943 type:complete len:631 (+) Transcript_120908:205-2097(+)